MCVCVCVCVCGMHIDGPFEATTGVTKGVRKTACASAAKKKEKKRKQTKQRESRVDDAFLRL